MRIMNLPVILLLLPLALAIDSDELSGDVHGDFGVKGQHGREREETLLGEESHTIPLSYPGLGGVVVPIAPTPVPVVEQHIHHHHIDHVVTHEEEVPEIDVWDIRDSVPGTPNEDYPVLKSIPKTRFTCDNKIPGYYADSDTKCQVFHRCSENQESARKKMDSFLCLNGTTFNQEILSCDWWENVRCDKASKFYGLNKELNMRGEDGKYIQLSAKREASPDKPLSPGIIPKDERVPLPPQFRSPLNRIQATEKPIDADSDLDEEIDEVELEEPPPISEVGPIHVTKVTTTEPPLNDEDEDIAYFFTPEQIKTIRNSKDFGERLTEEPVKNKSSESKASNSGSSQPTFGNFNSTEKQNETKSSFRIPVYKSSQPKTKSQSLFRVSNKREKAESENLFDNKLRESKRQVPTTEKTSFETKPKTRSRKLRKTKKVKTQKEKAAKVTPTASLPLGFPYPAQQVIVAPNGTSKILKYKHLLHTDITESFPPYVSGVRPVAPYPHYPSHIPPVGGQPPYTHYPSHPLNPLATPLVPAAQPPAAAVTYEHHHHHTAGTHHKALEPHHVFPPFQAQPQPGGSQKLLAPHEVIPALYHPDVVGPEVTGDKQSTKEGGMYLVQPHHALRAHPVAVNLGDRLAHHHHQVLPDNPLAAHHYAAESHLAVAAFHHLAEPHAHPPAATLSQFTSNLPTVYSQLVETPISQFPSAQASSANEAYASVQSLGSNSIFPSGQPPQNPIYSLNAPQQQYPLSDLLGMING